MKTFKTHYENLGSKEKEVIALCKEIILWTRKGTLLFLEKSNLREQATKLYEKLGKMDMINDDKYYEIYEQSGILEKDYEDLKEKAEKAKEFPIDFVNEKTEDIIEQIQQRVKKFGRFCGKQIWTTGEKESAYGDHIEIRVKEIDGLKYKVYINELWDFGIHESKPHTYRFISEFEKKFDIKTKTNRRLHDYASAYEFDISVKGIPKSKLESILKFTINTIKSTPRVRKETNLE